jgi:hypothetical protein
MCSFCNKKNWKDIFTTVFFIAIWKKEASLRHPVLYKYPAIAQPWTIQYSDIAIRKTSKKSICCVWQGAASYVVLNKF